MRIGRQGFRLPCEECLELPWILDELGEKVGVPITQGKPRLRRQPLHFAAGFLEHHFEFTSKAGIDGKVAQNCQQNCQGGETLLAVDDVGRRFVARLHQDYRTQEVRFVGTSIEGFCQVFEKLAGLLRSPGIWALVLRDPEIVVTAKYFAEGYLMRFQLFHIHIISHQEPIVTSDVTETLLGHKFR
ncbi:hypothetical protein G9444_0057 [Rhodococcus erythropolis]|uniref:Uncharacterized protein n=1 Tax=Rhodococcus erythropolis TaxID=1833 RepID=A0A6G9CKU7_RHOER|nr:hypothetical protein G9444_0057 [Rhodococcus erythropolis]